MRGNRRENTRELVKKCMEGAGSWVAGDREQYSDAIKSAKGGTSDGRMSDETSDLLSPHRRRAGKGVAELAEKKINYLCFTFLN